MSDEHDTIMECCDDCSREFEEGTMEYTNANDNYVCDACADKEAASRCKAMVVR